MISQISEKDMDASINGMRANLQPSGEKLSKIHAYSMHSIKSKGIKNLKLIYIYIYHIYKILKMLKNNYHFYTIMARPKF